MGRLFKTRCYMIGHMQFKNGEEWRHYVNSELSKLGIISWNPYNKPMEHNVEENDDTRKFLESLMKEERYDYVHDLMKQVRAQDLRLCDLADFVICHLEPEIASWGSAEEITTSIRMRKPTFISIAGGKKKCPLWIMGMIPHRYIYNSVEDIVGMIKRINDGSVEIDSDRWKLLKECNR